jgi:hypothetical protein
MPMPARVLGRQRLTIRLADVLGQLREIDLEAEGTGHPSKRFSRSNPLQSASQYWESLV